MFHKEQEKELTDCGLTVDCLNDFRNYCLCGTMLVLNDIGTTSEL